MQLKELVASMRECDSAIYHFPDGLSVQWQRSGDNVSLTLERMAIIPGDMDTAQMRAAFDVPDDVIAQAQYVAHRGPKSGRMHRYGQITLSWIERQPIINR